MKPDIVDELFARYYNEALLYTMSICRNRTVAEDVVSTAFYKALATADDEIHNFKPWLLTVCRNEYFSICRKNRNVSYDELPEDMADGREELAESIIRREEYRALYRALELLNDAQREVITLHYFSNMAVKDIAAVTGKSESNVKILMFRGRDRLKKLMEDGK